MGDLRYQQQSITQDYWGRVCAT